MSTFSMRQVHYDGNIWAGAAVSADLWELLLQRNMLVVMETGQSPFAVTLGVPHHAAPGVDRIADRWLNPKTGRSGRAADETTGLTGLAVFSALQEQGMAARLVIAVHALDHDPNKTSNSPYWQSIFSTPLPGLLFELHGAGRHRRHDLELSAGKNHLAEPHPFGKLLAEQLDPAWVKAVQARPGTSDATIFLDHQQKIGSLQNPALETGSLIHAGQVGIPALHLEMKSFFRQPDPNFSGEVRPTAAARKLAQAIAKGLKQFL